MKPLNVTSFTRSHPDENIILSTQMNINMFLFFKKNDIDPETKVNAISNL